jgi:hypothetical protein
MALTCGIANGIGVSCDDLRRIGGVNQRIWVFNQSGVTYTTDVNGYITALTLPGTEVLYPFESAKKSHSGGSELVVQEGGNKFFKQMVTAKLFGTTPADLSVIEALTTATVGVIIETNNKEFVLYGKDNGLEMTAQTQNTGQVAASDTTYTITFEGEERDLPKFILDTDYATTLAYLVGLE